MRIQWADLADNESSPRADDAVQFQQGGRLIWDFPEDRYKEGRVEGAVWVWELLSIALFRNDVPDAPFCSPAHKRV